MRVRVLASTRVKRFSLRRGISRQLHFSDVQFHNADLYDLTPQTHSVFDLVMTTIGVVGWMPDLKGFFDVVAGLVDDGGYYLMEEMHPVLLMYEPGQNGGPSYAARSYFAADTFIDEQGPDYYSGQPYQASPVYSFQYTLAQLMTTALDVGLSLRCFDEVGYDISLFCADIEGQKACPPLGIVLAWQKLDSGCG